MKRPLLLFASFCIVSLTGCSNDDPIVSEPQSMEDPVTNPENPEEPKEPESPYYFTYRQGTNDSSHITISTWIAIHDENGKFLDYKKAVPGSMFQFESVEGAVTDKITISLLSTYEFTGGSSYSFVDTYMDIDRGSVWSTPSIPAPSESSKSFDFSASNVPEWDTFRIKSGDSFGVSGASDFYYRSEEGPEEGTIQEDAISIFKSDDFIFTLTDKMGKSKYMMLSDVENEDIIDVDATELLDFDVVNSINVPSYTFASYSNAAVFFEQGDRQNLDLFSINHSTTSEDAFEALEFAYLNAYENYSSSISIVTDAYNYNYRKVGSPIKALSISPTISINISSDSPDNFGFTTDTNYEYQTVSWNSDEPVGEGEFAKNTIWSVHSLPGTFSSLITLPEALLTESGFYLEDLEHVSTSLHTKSKPYPEEITSIYTESVSQEITPRENETYTINVQNESTGKKSNRSSVHFSDRESLRAAHEFF